MTRRLGQWHLSAQAAISSLRVNNHNTPTVGSLCVKVSWRETEHCVIRDSLGSSPPLSVSRVMQTHSQTQTEEYANTICIIEFMSTLLQNIKYNRTSFFVDSNKWHNLSEVCTRNAVQKVTHRGLWFSTSDCIWVGTRTGDI